MTKDSFVIVRVSKDMKKRLVDLAGGKRKLSEYLRNFLTKLIG